MQALLLMKHTLSPLQIYERLLQCYGPQFWWPADHPFEMMVGAILTQNTSWKQVERAISNLKAKNMLHYAEIASCNRALLEEMIRPAGFFRQKAAYLQHFSLFYLQNGEIAGLKKLPKSILRKQLLALSGIGPETADSMLLYALDKPIFVIDNYTRRIFNRLGLCEKTWSYHAMQEYFQLRLSENLPLYQEYHALIVAHAKRHCLSTPDCNNCPLQQHCCYIVNP